MKHYKTTDLEASVSDLLTEYFKHTNSQYVVDIHLVKCDKEYKWYCMDMNKFHKEIDPAQYKFAGYFYYGTPMMVARNQKPFIVSIQK